MKKSLLVTLADKNFIDQVKQMLASVYFNAGWKGDYMLLAHNIPEKELKWFLKKGIIVKRCRPLDIEKTRKGDVLTSYSKFYLFTEDMKKWKNIVYLDADVIVRANLDDLSKVEGFAAVLDPVSKLCYHFDPGMWEICYLRDPAFNSGVMAFSTNLIQKDTFLKIKKLFDRCGKWSFFHDQGILNLYFHKRWKKLPIIYNVFPNLIRYCINMEKIDGIILHFAGKNTEDVRLIKSKNFFPHREWRHNLERADLIDLSIIPEGKKWNSSRKITYNLYLEFGKFLYSSFRVLISIFNSVIRHFQRTYLHLAFIINRHFNVG